jgi:recombination protein RecT
MKGETRSNKMSRFEPNQEVVKNNLIASYKELVRIKDKIRHALPGVTSLREDRLIQLFWLEMKRNPQLGMCTPESFCGSIVSCAQLGLEPGISGRIYLVKRWNSKSRADECTIMLGYRGMLELSFRSGRMTAFETACVYSNDTFSYRRGTNAGIDHEPAIGDKGTIIGVYAVATHTNGYKQFDFMNMDEVHAIRSRCSTSKKDQNSEGGTVGPWVTDLEAMAKKTVLRRLLNLIPSSIDLDMAIYNDEAIERGDIDMHKAGSAILGEFERVDKVVDIKPQDNSISQSDALANRLSGAV